MIERRRPGLEPWAELSEVGALVLALLLPSRWLLTSGFTPFYNKEAGLHSFSWAFLL